MLPADRVPLGAQAVGLTVDVQAPPLLNINLPATFKIVVKNTGTADATGVVVRDELPEGVEFLSSQPETRPADRLLFWKLSTIPAGTQQVITVRVKPTRIGPVEHAATVTMMAASKSRTMVRQPQLKVEVTTSPKQVLKGQPAQFKIAVTNPGDGAARNVSVQARLSPGLRHEESGGKQEENVIGLSINQILPGETINLEPLVVDTTQGGDQSCTVTATSPDVFSTDPSRGPEHEGRHGGRAQAQAEPRGARDAVHRHGRHLHPEGLEPRDGARPQRAGAGDPPHQRSADRPAGRRPPLRPQLAAAPVAGSRSSIRARRSRSPARSAWEASTSTRSPPRRAPMAP